ncbi:hypothetical protein GUJ93_ZPchr0013g36404 [Zizania palustris]|uniref:C2 domain-containing protein n=1 Tax=Zizania palustris TaxID=103762 RepID=A0A8J6BZB8_ZIZPA|nr:hypothetical protein GUJ93_ZPchr0013g36404 [Zizania palustris]
MVHVNDSSHPLHEIATSQAVVAKTSLSPIWDEEPDFLIGDVTEKLIVSMLNEDKYLSNDFLGRAKVSLAMPWRPMTSHSALPDSMWMRIWNRLFQMSKSIQSQNRVG